MKIDLTGFNVKISSRFKVVEIEFRLNRPLDFSMYF